MQLCVVETVEYIFKRIFKYDKYNIDMRKVNVTSSVNTVSVQGENNHNSDKTCAFDTLQRDIIWFAVRARKGMESKLISDKGRREEGRVWQEQNACFCLGMSRDQLSFLVLRTHCFSDRHVTCTRYFVQSTSVTSLSDAPSYSFRFQVFNYEIKATFDYPPISSGEQHLLTILSTVGGTIFTHGSTKPFQGSRMYNLNIRTN